MILGVSAHAQQNLVQNWQFSSYDSNQANADYDEPADWTQVGNTGQDLGVYVTFSTPPTDSNTYAYFAGYDQTNGGPSGITQNIATTTGKTYYYSFEVLDSGGDGSSPREFSFSENGSTQLDLVNTYPSVPTWQTYAGTFTATSATTTLAFWGGDDSTSSSYGYGLSSVNVQAVPEPMTMTALGIGVAAFVRRRKKS
jgi:hypothetical protein